MFELPPALAGSERLPTGAQEIVLARRVWPDGRTRAYVCGRAATQADLQELGGRLLSFYGQHEHRKLMLSTAQLELLDAYCGAEQQTRRVQLRAAPTRSGSSSGAPRSCGSWPARDRELDLLSFELDEIEAAADPQRVRARVADWPSVTGCAIRTRSPRAAALRRRDRSCPSPAAAGWPSCWPGPPAELESSGRGSNRAA